MVLELYAYGCGGYWNEGCRYTTGPRAREDDLRTLVLDHDHSATIGQRRGAGEGQAVPRARNPIGVGDV